MLSPLFRRTTNDRVVSQRGETLGSGRTVWRRVVHPTTVGVYFNEVGCEEGWLTVWGTRAVTTQVPPATKSRQCANQNIYLCESDQLRSNKSRKTASKWTGEQRWVLARRSRSRLSCPIAVTWHSGKVITCGPLFELNTRRVLHTFPILCPNPVAYKPPPGAWISAIVQQLMQTVPLRF